MWYDKIKALLPDAEILNNESMSRHTTFRVGGAADFFIKVSDVKQLQVLLPFLTEEKVPYYVIGKGSNLLVGDKGFRGVIIQMDETMGDINVKDTHIRVDAGASMAKLAKAAWQNGLTGLEFAAGIPGSVGGGIIMNAGAYGGEMKDVVADVTYLKKDGSIEKLQKEELEFSYRNSIFKRNPDWIVLSAEMVLKQGNKEDILAKMQDLAGRRKEKQPLEYASAGSTFKRPDGYFAGKLIQDAGLSGYHVGDAEVSTKHNGFIINKGNATAQEVRKVIEDVQAKVKEVHGVILEREVIYLGEF